MVMNRPPEPLELSAATVRVPARFVIRALPEPLARKLTLPPSVSVRNAPPEPPRTFTVPAVVRMLFPVEPTVFAPMVSVPIVSVVPAPCVAVPNPVRLTVPL